MSKYISIFNQYVHYNYLQLINYLLISAYSTYRIDLF